MFEGFVADDPRFAWLGDRAGGWQFGEQGILAALADAIDPTGQCVEIGAGDGEGLPLTIDPFYNRGNDCVLFEADAVSLGRLIVKYPRADNRGEFLEGMCYNISCYPSVAVIDIDGHELEAMRILLHHCGPSVLMVEHFDKCHPADWIHSQEIPSWLLGLELYDGFKIQNNAATVKDAALHFDYTRVGTTRVNSIFVHNSHLSKVSQ